MGKSQSTDTDSNRTLPSSMRHKRILDVAADQPDASIEDIAEQVGMATPDLVERVLEQYGDPSVDADSTNVAPTAKTDDPIATNGEAVDSTAEKADNVDASNTDEQPTHSESNATDDGTPSTDPEALSAKQRRTLQAIHEQPDATQREIAAEFDVTAATISNRVNSIDGFEWQRRRQFVETLFDSDAEDGTSDAMEESAVGASESSLMPPETEPHAVDSEERAVESVSATDGGQAEAVSKNIEQLADRVATIESRLDNENMESSSGSTGFDDFELLRKVLHACLESDVISEEEELRIMQVLLSGDK